MAAQPGVRMCRGCCVKHDQALCSASCLRFFVGRAEPCPGCCSWGCPLCLPAHSFEITSQSTPASPCQVRYGGHTFGGAAQPPAFGRVSEAFGPTYPGEPEGGLFPLQYPGVLFLFPLGAAGPGSSGHPGGLAQAAADVRHGGSGDRHAAGLPVPLSTPAARILVHHGAAASVAAARAAPPPPLAPGSPYWQQVEAVPGQGLLVGAAGQLLRFGDSPQDVVAELGPPSSTHRKPGGPGAPAVTSGAGVPPAVAAAAPDYYLTYCHLGLDALFCGASHRLKKLVLHANQPGHPDFGLYSRCNFRCGGAGHSRVAGCTAPGPGGFQSVPPGSCLQRREHCLVAAACSPCSAGFCCTGGCCAVMQPSSLPGRAGSMRQAVGSSPARAATALSKGGRLTRRQTAPQWQPTHRLAPKAAPACAPRHLRPAWRRRPLAAAAPARCCTVSSSSGGIQSSIVSSSSGGSHPTQSSSSSASSLRRDCQRPTPRWCGS